MKNFKRLLAAAIAASCLVLPFGGTVTADEPETAVSTAAPADQSQDGEFISDYVSQVIDYLSVYAKDGVNQLSLYKAGLLEILKQHPELYETVMSAILGSIDEHSVFYKSGEFEQFISQLEGAVGGIGITFNESNGNLLVGSVYENSPAAKAGILTGDILYSADGNNLLGVSIEVAQKYIRGQVGSPVTVGVLREGVDDVLYFTLTREEIGEKQSVAYKIVSAPDEQNEQNSAKVMYIKIYGFMDNTSDQFDAAVKEADSQNINNIIIDVRDNGGGYITQAVKVANYFVPNGNIIVTEDHKVDLFDITYKSNNERTQKNDVVVLVNEYSASASEILAAAIKENEVGVLIGTKTYGKGTVQSSVSLKDGEAMKYTAAYYLTPSGENIDKIGITPDAVVENGSVPFDYSGYEDFDYSRIYNPGDSDANISKAKKILNVWGRYNGNINDPYFDSELESAVAQFQNNQELFPYGVLDLTTQRELYNALQNTTVIVDNQLEAAFKHFGLKAEIIE